MKPTLKIIKAHAGLLLIYLVSACICFLSTGCGNKQNIPNDAVYNVSDTFPGLIVWVKPGTPGASLDDLVRKVKALGATSIVQQCADCDNTLMLLKGPGPETYIQHQTAPGGGGTTQGNGLSGEDGGAYYSFNFKMDFTDSIEYVDSALAKAAYKIPAQPDVTVAVFDTGIDTASIDRKYFYTGRDSLCFGALCRNGWNLSINPGDEHWVDDNNSRHGTLVSKFIIDEVNNFGGNGVKLLPVKIQNSKGVGNLFSVLCGFSYAAKMGAKIINASFGYYAVHSQLPSTTDSNAVLLKEYIKEYLTKRNILLVAAAGNRGANEADLGTMLANERNLDKVSFYPASLAGDPELPNVIAVTTVFETGNTGTVSPRQNFSNNVVDAGVDAGVPSFMFRNPFFPGKAVDGSSFATPILTGLICANYNLLNIPATSPVSKTQIFTDLLNNTLVHSNSSLAGAIRRGIVLKKSTR
jgi:subtilisin family serine protease